MDDDNEWKGILRVVDTRTRWFITAFIDGLFIIFWYFLQRGVSWAFTQSGFVVPAELSPIDTVVLITLQLVFDIATLIPILLYIYIDTAVMVRRARKTIDNVPQMNIPTMPPALSEYKLSVTQDERQAVLSDPAKETPTSPIAPNERGAET